MSVKTLAEYKAPYPEPTADQKRFAIFLDKKESDDMELNDFKVQLLPGRIESVDGANRNFIGGRITEEIVQGWGYNYHVVTLGPLAGTMMMPFGEAAEKKPKFVGMNNDSLIRYNSKLPIVVIAPKDCVLRYKIWTCHGSGCGGTEGIEAEEA